jgi:hypothetical protein
MELEGKRHSNASNTEIRILRGRRVPVVETVLTKAKQAEAADE